MNEIKHTPILIVGESGTGKSSTLESLNPERTIILNTEDKTLPFAHGDKFVNKYIISYKSLIATLDALIKDGSSEGKNKYDYVGIDSFTAITEIVERYADFAYQGFEQWKKYNEMIVTVIRKIKALPQQVIVFAIPEQKDVGFGESKSYARVKGKELKYGYLEKEFTIVLFTLPVYDEETQELEDVLLQYKGNKNNTAKSPRSLFNGKISNNGQILLDRVKEYYGR